MEAEYHRKQGHEVHWGIQKVNKDNWSHKYNKVVERIEGIQFNQLPWPDRIFTNAFDKKYQNNGNFKYKPGTYIQSSSGCWWGMCEFCVEKKNKFYVREVKDVYEEILECKKLGFKEVFDDSGTFPINYWLDDLLKLPKPGITVGCNMRMVDLDYKRMKDWGFRMVLFGIESANQGTLDMINKGIKVEDFKYLEKASKAGLDVHVAFMTSYPWENHEETMNTINFVKKLLIKGIAKTAQCSFYNPSNLLIRNSNDDKYIKEFYKIERKKILRRMFWDKVIWTTQISLGIGLIIVLAGLAY